MIRNKLPTFWAGFVGGVLHKTGDVHHGLIPDLYLTKEEAIKYYQDVRLVVIKEVPRG